LRAYVNTEIVSPDLIRNRLLDIWGAVRRIDPNAAKPVEFLLPALVGRDPVQKDEINAICDEVIAAPGQARPRIWPIGSG
jgi:hypothetical protein